MSEPQRASILIVDDDVPSRALLRRYLSHHDFDITDATCVREAQELLDRQHFDLVLLDVEMPGPSGLDLLRSLRQTFSPTELPVMMATVHDSTSDVVSALDAGANDYVTKPFDLPVVLARTRTQLSLKRAIDRARELEQHLAQQNTELEQANRRMRQELEAASRVQQALLPTALPRLKGAEFAWHYRPCAELAGDLLGVVDLGDQHACLYVLDVVDHGVKAALLAVMINRVLSRLLAVGGPATNPVDVALQLRREFPWDERTEQFFTLMLGVLDTTTREFRFVSAGQPGPIRLYPDGRPHLHRVPGVPIGLGEEEYEEHRLALDPGDRLYLFTDGLTEALRSGRGAFGETRCAQVLSAARSEPLEVGLHRLAQAVEDWTAPDAPHDDITVAAVELA